MLKSGVKSLQSEEVPTSFNQTEQAAPVSEVVVPGRQKVSSPVVGLRNALTKSVANEISRLFAQNFAQHGGQVWQIAPMRLSN